MLLSNAVGGHNHHQSSLHTSSVLSTFFIIYFLWRQQNPLGWFYICLLKTLTWMDHVKKTHFPLCKGLFAPILLQCGANIRSDLRVPEQVTQLGSGQSPDSISRPYHTSVLGLQSIGLNWLKHNKSYKYSMQQSKTPNPYLPLQG